MSRSRRLAPLLEVSARRIEDAAKAVARSRSTLATEEARLADLVEYRRQYDLAPPRVEATGAFSLANLRAFGARLDEAIRAQEGRLRSAREDLSRLVDEWSELRKRARAIELLAGRYSSNERRELARAEQREADDSGRARRKSGHSGD